MWNITNNTSFHNFLNLEHKDTLLNNDLDYFKKLGTNEMVGHIFDDLKEYGSMNALKEKGLVRLEGKEYIVKDGDESIKQVGRPYVNWEKVKEMLIDKGIIDDED